MKIGIGNDHAAVVMKNEIAAYLEELGYEVVDFGTDSDKLLLRGIRGEGCKGSCGKRRGSGDLDLRDRCWDLPCSQQGEGNQGGGVFGAVYGKTVEAA